MPARELAQIMHGLGVRAGRRVVCELTRMDAPLGRAVGNALEVDEALAIVRGEAAGIDDLDRLVRGSAAQLLELAEPDLGAAAARARVDAAIGSGAAAEHARRWIAAQGGDPRVVDAGLDALERAPVVVPVPAPRGGVVAEAGALAIGLAAVRLGAGRARKQDPVDPAVGIVLAAKPGDRVETGAPLAHVHARSAAAAAAAADDVVAAFAIADDAPPPLPIVIETIA